MDKKAKRFIRLLSKKLAENKSQNDAAASFPDSGQQMFQRALDDLPKCALKTELQQNAATYSKKLQVLIKNGRADTQNDVKTAETKERKATPPANHPEVSDDVVVETKKVYPLRNRDKPSRKNVKKKTGSKAKSVAGGKEEKEEDGGAVAMVMDNDAEGSRPSVEESSPTFTYNMYTTDSRTQVVDTLRRLPQETKMRLAPHTYCCLCRGSSFKEFLQSIHTEGKIEPTYGTFALIIQEILAGFGTSDVEVLIRCLVNCLSGMLTEAEQVLKVDKMESLKELQDFILRLMLWAKLRYNDCKETNQINKSLPNFDDLSAAILSVYVDVSVVISRLTPPANAEANGRHTLSRILLLIGSSQVDQIHLLLQVTEPNDGDSNFMLPIFRHILGQKPTDLTNEMVVKYICAVRFGRAILGEKHPKFMEDITNVAVTTEPSGDFLLWMYDLMPTAYGVLPDSVKSKREPVVSHLLLRASTSYLDELMDLMSEMENNDQDGNRDGRNHDDGSRETGGLFYTDTTRDENAAGDLETRSEDESITALESRLDSLLEGFDNEVGDESRLFEVYDGGLDGDEPSEEQNCSRLGEEADTGAGKSQPVIDGLDDGLTFPTPEGERDSYTTEDEGEEEDGEKEDENEDEEDERYQENKMPSNGHEADEVIAERQREVAVDGARRAVKPPSQKAHCPKDSGKAEGGGGSECGMSLRSMYNQSSLLRFFSPIGRREGKSKLAGRPPQRATAPQVVPDYDVLARPRVETSDETELTDVRPSASTPVANRWGRRKPPTKPTNDSPRKKEINMSEDAVSAGIRRIREECTASAVDLKESKRRSTTDRPQKKKKKKKKWSLTFTGDVDYNASPGGNRRATMSARKALPAGGKRGDAPPSKASPATGKRLAVSAAEGKATPVSTGRGRHRSPVDLFGDNCVPETETDDDGLITAKRMRLQPKDLKEDFANGGSSSGGGDVVVAIPKKSCKKEAVDIQPVSESSQECFQTKPDMSGIRKQAAKQLTIQETNRRTPIKTGSPSTQMKMGRRTKQPQSRGPKNESRLATTPNRKRSASLPAPSKAANVKPSRKPTRGRE